MKQTILLPPPPPEIPETDSEGGGDEKDDEPQSKSKCDTGPSKGVLNGAPEVAGHTAIAINNGHDIMTFGGYFADKKDSDFSGDNVYYNDVYILRSLWDQDRSELRSYGWL